jgi:xanthine dehydrogenase accessory factor
MGKLVDSRGRAWLVTRIPGRDGTVVSLGMGALGGDDGVRGALDAGLTREVVSRFAGRQPDIVEWQGESFLVEPLGREGCVVIFGAGHVSQALAPLARGVGFRTVVCDDREEFANRDRFPSADEVLVLDSFEDPLNGVEIGEESYLVIVTRGHAHDQTVLGRALATTAGYIGMIGSRRKRDAIYGALMEEGFTRADLERVCSPIGLDIGAETPEEIAVSIVAELIQARARRGS